MSLLVGLGPLLDASAILTIARQFWSAHSRLSLQTRGNLPSAAEFPIAMRMYVDECDRQREQIVNNNQMPILSPSSQPSILQLRQLERYLTIADCVYSESEASLRTRLLSLGICEIIGLRRLAEKWKPGYTLCHDPSNDSILIVIRGSQEVSDFVTNLSAETEPFLDGYGHQGVVRSAYDVASQVLPLLVGMSPSRRFQGGVVILGHSLGAAVAAALTILIRENDISLPETMDNTLKEKVRNAKCYSFAPPPFASENVAQRSASLRIHTFVMGLDVVPRLSAASLERLLVIISRFDWGGAVGRGMMRMVGGFFGNNSTNENDNIDQADRTRNVSGVVESHTVTGLATASNLVGTTAEAAYNSRQATGPSLFGSALGATAIVARFIGNQLHNSHQRMNEMRQSQLVMASAYGMNEADVERQLGEGPREVFLAGRIWYLERRFQQMTRNNLEQSYDGIKFVEKNRNDFCDIEASNWMVHDHSPVVMLRALEKLILWSGNNSYA